MELFGHRDVRMLDCDRATWLAEGRPWSAGAPVPSPSTYPIADRPRAIRALRSEVFASIGGRDTLLLDVRSTEEFAGERFWPSGGMQPDGRAGHVPSAVRFELRDLYDERGAFRDRKELRRQFAPVMADDRDVITYCTIGGRASTTWFVLTHLLGRQNVRVYDGSWAEWGRTPDAPVVTGN